LPGNLFQCLENALALEGDRFEHRFILALKFFGEGFNRKNVGEVAFVELQHVRNLVEVVTVLLQVRHEVVEGLGVGVHPLLLGIGNENDSIHAAKDQLAAGIIEDLSGDSVEVNAGFESANGS
jgi:hypothetical protein